MAGVALALSGCGTTAENADVPQGVYAGVVAKPDVAAPSIQIAETGPSVPEGGRRVAGTSCRNKIWQPDPNAENAVALMKQQAVSLGMNAIHSVEVKNDPVAIARNCWAAIIATGIAFKLSEVE